MSLHKWFEQHQYGSWKWNDGLLGLSLFSLPKKLSKNMKKTPCTTIRSLVGIRDYRIWGCSTRMRISTNKNGDMEEPCHLEQVSSPEFKPFLIGGLSVCHESCIIGLAMFHRNINSPKLYFSWIPLPTPPAKQWTYKAYHTQKDIIHDIRLATRTDFPSILRG